MKKYHFLVTGFSGYIASNLVKKLLSEGHIVSALTTKENPANNSANNLEIYVYDGSFSSVNSVFKDNKIDFVLHLASSISYYHDIEDLTKSIDCNVKYGSYLLEAMSQNGCFNFINTGTYWQYGENGEVEPICFYAATKQAFEAIINYYVFDKKISALTINLTDVFGLNDNRNKILSAVKNSSKGNCEIDLTDGKQLIDILYVDDVVNAYLCAVEVMQKEDFKGQHKKYFLTSNRLQTLKELVTKYLEISKLKVKVNWGARHHRKNQIMKPYIGEILPNWEAKISLEEGLKIIANEK